MRTPPTPNEIRSSGRLGLGNDLKLRLIFESRAEIEILELPLLVVDLFLGPLSPVGLGVAGVENNCPGEAAGGCAGVLALGGLKLGVSKAGDAKGAFVGG